VEKKMLDLPDDGRPIGTGPYFGQEVFCMLLDWGRPWPAKPEQSDEEMRKTNERNKLDSLYPDEDVW
jgi:hypothetical protein